MLLLINLGWNSSAQKLYLKISSTLSKENIVIDSIGYNPNHNNTKTINEETNLFLDKLVKIGFITAKKESYIKINDSIFLFQISMGKKEDFIHIYIGRNSQLKSLFVFEQKSDTLILPFTEVESFLNLTLNRLEKKGFALAKLKLINIQRKLNYLEAELELISETRRQLNDIVIKGYVNFPKGHSSNLKRLYKNRIFNQENLKNIYVDFNKFRFIKQLKYPEILFTKDSTKVYVYLEKAKANSFDGFIGFSNNEANKIIFNGYLDLTLNNILNTGETVYLYWKSDGKDQKTFNGTIELPYIFKSPFGLKAQLNIFKQDSTFQNTKTELALGYFFNYNSRLYIGYQTTESSDIQYQNSTSIIDFNNSFINTNFEFLDFKNDNFLFPEKTKINLKIGFGTRRSKLITNSQALFAVDLKHSIYLNEKNSFNIKSQNFYLKCNDYIINELYRFGGINSIRGFNENSLQANFFTSILTEYRYALAPSIYVHSIIDYGYYQDKTSNNKGNLLGFGFGFGLLTKNGLFNIIYVNGSTKEQAVKGSNSIVHISFKTNF